MENTNGTIRVLIADDQTLFRNGLARLLDEDPRIAMVGEAADGLEAVTKTEALNPNVILMDVQMPGLDGVEATKRIVADHPEVKILILSTFDTDGYVIKALRAGACGYLLKDAEADAIVSSIVAVMSGERVMAGAVTNRILDLLLDRSLREETRNVAHALEAHAEDMREGNQQSPGNSRLTPREQQILAALCRGASNKELARLVMLKPNTVRTHMQNIFSKLGVHSRLEAVTLAFQLSLKEREDGGTTVQVSTSRRETN